MGTRKGRRIAMVSVAAVILVGGALVWINRDGIQGKGSGSSTTLATLDEEALADADSSTVENGATKLPRMDGETGVATDEITEKSTAESRVPCPPVDSAEDKKRLRAFVESVTSRDESGMIAGDGRSVDFSLQVANGSELLVNYDGEDWSHAFSSPILGLTPDLVITADGTLYRLDMRDRRVNFLACDLLEAIDRCVRVQNLIADGDLDGAKGYVGPDFEVIDTEKEFGSDEVFQKGPFNVKAFAMRKAEGRLGVTSFSVFDDGTFALSNRWAVFYLYRRDGSWMIARGYMRPD